MRTDSAVDAKDGPNCKELSQRFNAALRAPSAELAACSRDEDCTTWSPTLMCERARVGTCPSPIARDRAEQGQRWLADFAREVCEDEDRGSSCPTCECWSGPRCGKPPLVRCVDARCREVPRTCTDLLPGECGQVPDCVPLRGIHVDAERGCYDSEQDVACIPSTLSCPPVIALARDADGEAWQFASGCIPSGFTRGVTLRDGSELLPVSDEQFCR